MLGAAFLNQSLLHHFPQLGVRHEISFGAEMIVQAWECMDRRLVATILVLEYAYQFQPLLKMPNLLSTQR